MNAGSAGAGRLNEDARSALDTLAEALGQVFEAMAGERPGVSWRAAPEPSPAETEALLWWEQPLKGLSCSTVWVGAPQNAWEYAGTAALKAAGLDSVEIAEARSTWLEMLQQALSPMARAIGAVIGKEIGCDSGIERGPSPDVRDFVSLLVQFPETGLPPVHVGLSAGLLDALATQPRPFDAEQGVRDVGEAAETAGARSRTMDLLLDVELPVSISFGKMRLPMRDVLKLTTGSIVELDRGVNDLVEVLVNQRLVARGEVVVVEGNYGVRIQQIASPQDRLRSVQ